MFFSVVMQFVYSLGKKQKQKKNKNKKKKTTTEFGGGREGLRGTRAEGLEGQILVADDRELQ